MKKWIVVVASVALLWTLTACNEQGEREEIEDGTIQDVGGIVIGTVKALDGRLMTLEVDTVEEGPSVEKGTDVSVHLSKIDLGVYESIEVGDVAEVHYDGTMTRSIPPQLTANELLLRAATEPK